MEKFILRSLLILGTLGLAACMNAEPPEDTTGIDSHTVITSSFSQHDENSISGSGTIRFTESFVTTSSRSLALKASLDQAIALSSITTVLYSSNAIIPSNDGIAVKISRSGITVNMQISFNGNTASVNSSRLVYVDPMSVDLIVEVHNINSKARVLIWKRDFNEYSPATALVDTDRSGDLNSTLPVQNGGGPYVGLILQNATVSAARLDVQKVLD